MWFGLSPRIHIHVRGNTPGHALTTPRPHPLMAAFTHPEQLDKHNQSHYRQRNQTCGSWGEGGREGVREGRRGRGEEGEGRRGGGKEGREGGREGGGERGEGGREGE